MANAQYLSSDEELLAERGAVVDSQRPRNVTKVVGGFVLVACVTMAVMALVVKPHSSSNNLLTARRLYESPEVANVLTDQIMEFHRQQQRPADFEQWKKTHTAVSRNLKKFGHENAALLDQLALDDEEKDGLLHRMRHRSDRRLQNVGHVMARALGESAHLSKAERKQRVVDALQPHKEEIQQLRQEILAGIPQRTAGLNGEAAWEKILSADVPDRRLQVVGNQYITANPYYETTTPAPFAPIAPPAAPAVVAPVVMTPPPFSTVAPAPVMEQAEEMTSEAAAMSSSLGNTLGDMADKEGQGGLSDVLEAMGPLLKTMLCGEKIVDQVQAELGTTTFAPVPLPSATTVPPVDALGVVTEGEGCLAQRSAQSQLAELALACDMGIDKDAEDCTRADAEPGKTTAVPPAAAAAHASSPPATTAAPGPANVVAAR